jgi:hypothetical protein
MARTFRQHPTTGARKFALGIVVLLATVSAVASAATTKDPSSSPVCARGEVACVDRVIREMSTRFDAKAASCSHDAIFALLYLRVTEAYRRAVEDPDFFHDNAFVNHEDAVFASYYFKALDAWSAGKTAQVPAAWRIALDASTRRTVSGSGDMVLGVNAHVNRDLPFVLAEIGLVAPDGTSRKADHDKVNEIFYAAYGPALAEMARRFDPTIDDGDVPGTTLDQQALVQLIVEWREEAWWNAQRLVSAPNPTARALVSQSIENAAATKAKMFRDASLYAPLGSSAPRDAWCAAHGQDA